MKKVVIVGGHGQVSLRLSRLIGPSNDVTSIIRDASRSADIIAARSKALACDAGGKAGEERCKKVDYEGAVKVFDAIEAVEGVKPRLILVSSVDVRDPNKVPDDYNDGDKSESERLWKAIPAYMRSKYEADKNLVQKMAFKWTIVRPGWLSDNPGKASIEGMHITGTVSREDVAKVLALLLGRPDRDGLALDLMSGEMPIEGAMDAFIRKG